MHKNVIPHVYNIDKHNVNELADPDFAFICIDNGPSKELIVDFLEDRDVPYADCGMGIDASNGQLAGIVRVTVEAPENKGQARSRGRINFSASGEDDKYDANIQIAELNALNAVLAVIQWKKNFGFYRDCINEDHITYTIDVGKLVQWVSRIAEE